MRLLIEPDASESAGKTLKAARAANTMATSMGCPLSHLSRSSALLKSVSELKTPTLNGTSNIPGAGVRSPSEAMTYLADQEGIANLRLRKLRGFSTAKMNRRDSKTRVV
jgi:hypothetical protein